MHKVHYFQFKNRHADKIIVVGLSVRVGLLNSVTVIVRDVDDVEAGRDAFEDVSEQRTRVTLFIFHPLCLVLLVILLNNPK
jgi:hypothetical protein